MAGCASKEAEASHCASGEKATLLTSCTWPVMRVVGFLEAAGDQRKTVKSSEPLTTVLLAVLLIGEVESLAPYAMLLPIVLGVGLASFTIDHDYSEATTTDLIKTITALLVAGYCTLASKPASLE